VEDSLQATPTSLEQLRANLEARLETIGVNVGAVPEDVRDQLVRYCMGLKAFVQDGEIDDICNSIAVAIEQADRQLLEQVSTRLGNLQGN
jgi:hypothetical protein